MRSSEVHSLTLLFSRPRVPRSTVSLFPFILSDGIEVYRGLGEQIERTGTGGGRRVRIIELKEGGEEEEA